MIEEMISNSQVRHLRLLLDKAKNVVLTCHVRPDGDAIGSTLSLMHLLRARKIQAHVVTPDTPPHILAFMPGFSEIVPFSRYEEYAGKLMGEADLIIGCDFNTPSRLSDLEPVFNNAKAAKVIIDHHEAPGDFADLLISYPDMSSTCELIFRVLCAMEKFGELSANKDAATCLTTGIITDTRNLSVNTKHLDLYDIMKELLSIGVNKRLILKETLETKSEGALKLTSFALCERLKVYPKHKAALVWLSQEDLERFDYKKGDTEGLVNQALELRGIIYAVFMRQEKDKVRLSMRSLGSFPVSKICSEHFGGGGHIQAAGGDFVGSIQDCISKFETIMSAYDAEASNAAARLQEQGYLFN
ncbi:MAG: bifunctional oligoribonuclease/PAP phosphatase NrnA [Ruminococcus sp.]|nr:bifunctional oligoribonuclease/PAP phosphatase NrnA [Ruminococcus sp.]